MALDYRDTYPSGTEDNGDYPQGKAKNVSAPGAGDGFPFDKGFVNDIFGFLQALLAGAAITPSGVPDTAANSDYYDALIAAGTEIAQDPDNVAAAIAATSEKSTLADSDTIPLTDSAAAGVLKFIQWINLKINIGRVAQMPIGIVVSNNAGDATNDLDFAIGSQRDSTNTYNINATAGRTKRADANWAEGDAQGMKASGAAAWGAQVWHVFLIGKSTNPNAFDYVMDTSLTCVNGLADAAGAGYDIYKRIMSQKTAGAAWLGFVYTVLALGRIEIMLKVPVYQFDKDWAGADDTAQTGTLGSVPTGIKVKAILGAVFRDATPAALSSLLITSLDQTDTAPSGVAGSYLATFFLPASGATVPAGASGIIGVITSTSGTFRYRATSSTADHAAAFTLHGWEDVL